MIEWQAFWMILLLPLPWIVREVLPAAKNADERGVKVPFATRLRQVAILSSGQSKSPQWHVVFLAWLMWSALLLAAAGPQLVGDPIPLPQAGRDLMLAIDVSGSMNENDMIMGSRAVSRLDAVKVVASEFIEARKGDRIGLILFGDQAYLQAPLTFDVSTIRQMLLESVVGIAGKKTAMGDAIGLAIKRSQEAKNSNKVLILLTDGRSTAGEVEPLDAAQLAKEQGLKIYTIGVGADARAQSGFFGGMLSMGGGDLDEPTLEAIAEVSGGRYYRARNPKELADIYSKLNQLEAIEQDEQVFRPVTDLFHVPLSAAIGFALMLLLSRARAMSLLLSIPRRLRGASHDV